MFFDTRSNVSLLQCMVFPNFRIYAGYNKPISVVQVHRPGSEFDQYSSVNGNKEGQSGEFFIL